MTVTRKDPLRNFRFRVEVDNTSHGFSEVVIGESITQTVEYREGWEDPHPRKLSGRTAYGNVVLKGGLSESLDLYNWRDNVIKSGSSSNRKTVVIIVLDEDGKDKARYTIANAWPSKYVSGPLSAAGNEVMIETIELANEGIERVA